MPLNLLPLDDGAADLVEVNSVVAGSIEIYIVDETLEGEDVDVDIDVEEWEVEVEVEVEVADVSAEEEAVVANARQSEHDKGVWWLSRVPN